MPRLFPCLLALTLLAPVPALAQSRSYEVQPSSIDGGVHNFDSPNLVIPNTTLTGAPLVVFLTGAGGKPTGQTDFLKFVATQGFPVIALEYDDDPGAADACPKSPDADCAEAFRRMRVDGVADGPGASPVSNPPNETIVARLTFLLRFLTQDKPGEGWDYYLDGDNIRWDRVVVSGQSQGAGMAAYIAKHHEVARVVLFSSPQDVTGADNTPAQWLGLPSATPADRWFAEYHARETAAGLIKTDYAALQIPADHIHVFNQDLTSGFHGSAYDASSIRDRRYQGDWMAMFGKPQADGSIK